MLQDEEKKLTELIGKNKDLEVTNFVLKDQLDTIKEKLAKVEADENTLTQLMTSLEAEKDKKKFDDLMKNIKNVREEQHKTAIHINLMEKETGMEIQQDSLDKSFDFIQEISKIPKMKPRVVERFPRNIMTSCNSNNKRGGLKERNVLLRNKLNNIVKGLIDKVMKERASVLAMPKKLLLKKITQTYNEMQMPWENYQDLPTYLFNSLLNKFGIQKAAERKFLQIIGGCLKYADCLRIKMFGRFIGLYDEYLSEDCNRYIDIMKTITKTYY